eukprot:m.787861 g.787861  ORF g.787861 m.787861 type:complete len:1143 (-) comp23309_c1_seq2:1400-4828(-)
MMTTRVCHAASNRARLLLKNAAQIVTVQGSSRGKIGTHEMNELSVLEKHNVLVGADGKISHITDEAADTLAFEFKPERVVDCSHKVIFPGFVDPHTHVVFSGDRSHEMAMKLAGASYEDVHNAGGGINHTVRHTRGSTRHELQQLALPRLDRMMQRGTTHVEIKSGYGLDVETEMKMLLVVEDLRVAHRMGITSTYLAHAVPVGMNGSTMTASVLNEHFPALATLQRQGDVSVDQVDVFCEQGFFNREEARQILCAGQGLGLAAAFHGDELNDLSCGALAAEIGARSVSHLEELSADGVEQMARAGVYGVLLPTTAHVLRLRPPPARAMIDGGVPVALATDFNPNAHCMDMPTVMNLACVLLRMTMAEAVVASTLNAAAALGLGDTLGSIEVGKQGDLVVFDAPTWEHVVYQMGGPEVSDVFKHGRSMLSSPTKASMRSAATKAWPLPQASGNTHASAQAVGGSDLSALAAGIPFDKQLPRDQHIDPSVPHAPPRAHGLNKAGKRLAVQNALRYFPADMHAELGAEFLDELETLGHIYMHRFRPTTYAMKAHPIGAYPATSVQAAAIQLMIMNNLDPAVAQYPHELVTYGGNGSAFSNWAQYHLTMAYLSRMEENQTLVLNSGHPQGLFTSHADAPRLSITNGLTIPNYSTRSEYERMYAQGVSQYGQMTAGSFCYIGPQGIVHGTTLTLLNAGRKYLGVDSLQGKLFVTAGLGGMSGAQAKAAVVAGSVTIVAEVKEAALSKRHAQGWVVERAEDLDDCFARARAAVREKRATSIAYHGNVVDLWEALADSDVAVDLGSDQTSCHDPFGGGYYPVGMSTEAADELMSSDPKAFRDAVQVSLRRHVSAVNRLAAKGMQFWDYGNSFLLEASRAGADIMTQASPEGSEQRFRYPSYVEDIMGDIFSLGFGPFRWVCTSGDPKDLAKTDEIAASVLAQLRDHCRNDTSGYSRLAQGHFEDNHLWITEAGDNQLTVGSQARILYANAEARQMLAQRFNDAVASGVLSAPVVISRDHHDVSGTDAPWRETSDVRDGSHFCADMAIQNVIGDAARGATWVAIHNGGGTGWGEAINGGFGMVLDGRSAAASRATTMLEWDVYNGVARRAWAGNECANVYIDAACDAIATLDVTHRTPTDPKVLATLEL